MPTILIQNIYMKYTWSNGCIIYSSIHTNCTNSKYLFDIHIHRVIAEHTTIPTIQIQNMYLTYIHNTHRIMAVHTSIPAWHDVSFPSKLGLAFSWSWEGWETFWQVGQTRTMGGGWQGVGTDRRRDRQGEGRTGRGRRRGRAEKGGHNSTLTSFK